MKAKSILIIEDEHALGSALSLLVTRMGHRPELVASAAAGREALKCGDFHAAVIDIGLPDESGLKVLKSLRGSGSTMPVLVITAHATLQHALDSQKQGATAYMNKPLNCLRDVFTGIARAASGDFPVLISGPGGSGKTLAARLIHRHGRQSSSAVHELDGARLEGWNPNPEWHGGSVILENLDQLNAAAQGVLYEWLQAANESPLRFLATLSMNPVEGVEQGRLREDLYFALKPGSISMPPLCERSGDIPALCHYFAAMKLGDGKAAEITPAVMAALQSHDWPGNVRELKHVLDYALSMSGGGALFLTHLPEAMREMSADAAVGCEVGSELELALERWLVQELSASEEVSYDELLQKLEAQMLQYLMERFERKPTRLAAAMNLHRGTLRQKLQRCGLQ
jgi:DNA-binding NtrC family response regulator